MIDLKPYGAFFEYSIRPTFEELNKVLDRLEKQGFYLTRENIKDTLKYLSGIYLESLIINLIKTVLVALIVAYTFYKCAT